MKVLNAWASVDYITAVFSDQLERDFANVWIQERLDEFLEADMKIGVWSGHGYNGWSSAEMRVGDRERDTIIQLNSGLCATHWRSLILAGGSISRLDLALTLQLDDDYREMAKENFKRLDGIREEISATRNYSLISGLFGGDTLYVGRRVSSQFGRLYDKMRQSGEEEFCNCWRYEVELKRPMSSAAATTLLNERSVEKWIGEFVTTWFRARRVDVPDVGTNTYNAIRLHRVQTTTDKTLEWLRSQVGPSVKRLLDKGLETEVLKALQLDFYNQGDNEL